MLYQLPVSYSAHRITHDRSGHGTRWPGRSIGSGNPIPDRGSGLALLWPENDVVLNHGETETPLRAHDLAVIDRGRPLSLAGPAGWAAQLFDFGSRSFLLRPGHRRYDLARPIDGDLPLALIVKRLWKVGREVDAMGVDDELIPQHLTDIIGMICGRLLAGDDSGLSSHRATTIERARLLIAAQLDQPTLSPATLAAQLRVSRRHLSSLFAASGTTTTGAILTRRLARAQSLLADPANRCRQIAEIAVACGFADQGYFARCFRKHVGITPKAYRDTSKSDVSEHNLGQKRG